MNKIDCLYCKNLSSFFVGYGKGFDCLLNGRRFGRGKGTFCTGLGKYHGSDFIKPVKPFYLVFEYYIVKGELNNDRKLY